MQAMRRDASRWRANEKPRFTGQPAKESRGGEIRAFPGRPGDRPRPSSAPVPGIELPTAVYGTVMLCVVAIVAAAWLAYGHDAETRYLLFIVGMVFAAFAAIPTLIFLNGRKRAPRDGSRDSPTPERFLAVGLETASGPLSGREAWLQIALVPLSLALAAILIGTVTAFT